METKHPLLLLCLDPLIQRNCFSYIPGCFQFLKVMRKAIYSQYYYYMRYYYELLLSAKNFLSS